MRNRGQQEIVGFVLIVVLVVIGLMVFLIISLRDTPENTSSLEVKNILNVIMKHTTECAIVYEPNYDDFEDLFKSCYQEKQCSNLGLSACDYLNDSLRLVLRDLMDGEAMVGAYELDFFTKDGDGLLRISDGNCTGGVNAAQRNIVSSSDSLIIRMKTCNLL